VKIPKVFLLLIPGLLAVQECAHKDKITGSYYIPREDMVSILTDMYMMDGITDSYKYYRVYQADDTIDFHSRIFEKYNTDLEHFDSTLKVYSYYPELLDKIYDEVIMNLAIIQDSLDNKPSKKTD